MREEGVYPQPGPDTISDVLHTPGQPTTDLAFGIGQRYELAGGLASLEIFPEHRLTRITTAAARVELFGTPPPRVVNGQVVIKRETAQEELSLTVSPEGTVVFGYVHRPATPEEPVTAPQQPQEPLGVVPATSDGTSHVPAASDSDAAPADDPPAADLTPPATLRPPTSTECSPEPTGTGRSPEATDSPPDTPLFTDPDSPQTIPDATPTSGRRTTNRKTTEQQPRLQLTGRLGRDPSFRTSPRGTLVGRFPLAVHQRDTTTWHSILAFGQRAEQLQHRADAGELTKGREVSLIGYPHTREQPTREGGTKTVTEIYAVAVTRR